MQIEITKTNDGPYGGLFQVLVDGVPVVLERTIEAAEKIARRLERNPDAAERAMKWTFRPPERKDNDDENHG